MHRLFSTDLEKKDTLESVIERVSCAQLHQAIAGPFVNILANGYRSGRYAMCLQAFLRQLFYAKCTALKLDWWQLLVCLGIFFNLPKNHYTA